MAYSQNFDGISSGANVNSISGWVTAVGSGLVTSSTLALSSPNSVTVTSNTANNGDGSIYNGLGQLTDCEMQAAFRFNGGTAGSLRARFELRSNGSDTWYETFVTLAQAPTVTIRKRLAGADQTPFTLTGSVAQAIGTGNWYYIKWRCTGSTTVTHQVKVWLASGTEPTDWEVVATDTSGTILQGYPGMRMEYSSAAFKSYADDFTVTDLAGGGLVANSVSFSSVTSTSLTVTTTAATGGTGPYNYQFQRAPNSGGAPGTWANVGPNSTALSYNDSGLSASTTYFYRVVVTDSLAATANGPSSSVTTSSTTIVPGVVSLTSTGDGTVSVTSTAPSGGGGALTNQWYRSTVPNTLGSPVAGATSLTLNDTGLTNGVAYFYSMVTSDGSTTAQSNQTAGTPNQTIYVCEIGDSWNTTTCTSGSTTSSVTTSAAGNIMGRKLQSMFNSGVKINALNRGVGGTNGSNWQTGGTNMNGAQSAMTAIVAAVNWWVAVHLGINDSSINFSSPTGGESKAVYKAYLKNMLDGWIAWGAKGVIFHKPPFIGDISANHNALGIALLQQYGDAIDELAAENPGKAFVGADEFKYFMNNQGDLGGDKVHPTPADSNGAGGAPNVATMWAEAIYPIISGIKTPNVRF